MRRRTRARSSRSQRWPFWLVLLAVALALVVAAFATGPSVAFTSATADRGSSVAVAEDTDGLVGLDVTSSVSAGSTDTLVTTTNRLDRTATVTVSLDTPSEGSLSNAQTTLTPGETLTTQATIDCDSAPDSVTFTVSTTDGSGFTATATRSTTVTTAECSGGTAPIQFVSGSTSVGGFSGPSGGTAGSLEFTLENTDSVARTLTGFELREAGNATALSFDGPPPVNLEPGKDELYVDATGGATDSEGAAEASRGLTGYDVGTGTQYSLDETVTLDAGETATVSLYRFVANGAAYSFESGDRVVLDLIFQDGTTVTIEFTV